MNNSLDLVMEEIKKGGMKYHETNQRLKEMCEGLEEKIFDLLEACGYEDDLFILLDQEERSEPVPYYLCLNERLVLTGIIPDGAFNDEGNIHIASIHWDVLTETDYEEVDDPALTGMLAVKAEMFGSCLRGRRTFRIQFIHDVIPLLSKIADALQEDAAENADALKLEKQLAFLNYLDQIN